MDSSNLANPALRAIGNNPTHDRTFEDLPLRSTVLKTNFNPSIILYADDIGVEITNIRSIKELDKILSIFGLYDRYIKNGDINNLFVKATRENFKGNSTRINYPIGYDQLEKLCFYYFIILYLAGDDDTIISKTIGELMVTEEGEEQDDSYRYIIFDYFMDIAAFFDNDIPFAVCVFLIKNGFKDRFLDDKYYYPLLFETPEIYNQVKNDETKRMNGEVLQIFSIIENPLSFGELNKYQDYVIQPFTYTYDVRGGPGYIIESNDHNRNRKVFGLNNYYTIVNNMTFVDKTILNVGNVAICGGYINKLITSEHISTYNEDNINDIDIFIYRDKENNISDQNFVKNKVSEIMSILIPNGINIISYSDNAITIIISNKIRYQIIKRLYSSIE